MRHGQNYGVDRILLVAANDVNTLIPAANKALARLEGLADVDLECSIGGAYEMPDGRKFWIDGPVAREIVKRIKSHQLNDT